MCLCLSGVRNKVLRNVNGRDLGSALRQQPRVVAFSTPNIQPGQPRHRRQHLEEGGGVEVVPVDVIAGSRQCCPGMGVGIPKTSYFLVIHHKSSSFWVANAKRQPRLEAGAQRTLEGVGCTRY